ncbi:MAG: hypothetical protein ACK56Y_06995, partial [Pseudanabaena sp.]
RHFVPPLLDLGLSLQKNSQSKRRVAARRAATRLLQNKKQRQPMGLPLLFVKFILIPMGLSGYNGGAKKLKIYEISFEP